MLLPVKQIGELTEKLAIKTGQAVAPDIVVGIVKAHPQPRRFAKKLMAILQAELDEAFRDPAHEEQTRAIKMALSGADIPAAEQALGLFYPFYDFSSLGKASQDAVVAAATALRRDGVAVLDLCLQGEQVSALIDVLKKPTHEFAEKGTGIIHAGYDPQRAEQAGANTVWLVNQDKLNQEPLIQGLAFDPHILAIAQSYLGAPPIHVQTNAWWSLAHDGSDKALASSAQKFHQDKEFVKFIKLFVYLTDVGPQNGPHEYVTGSIADYQRAAPRRSKPGKRFDDVHIAKSFGEDRIRTMTGAAGTMILEDTLGFHRGVPVLSGHRLLLQFEYANSLFCSPVARFSGHNVQAWADHHDDFARLFANYDSAA
ncbi:MAG: phytanoyl-CoA dioxygenase family protein [Alphaproteobacteria bacterium]